MRFVSAILVVPDSGWSTPVTHQHISPAFRVMIQEDFGIVSMDRILRVTIMLVIPGLLARWHDHGVMDFTA